MGTPVKPEEFVLELVENPHPKMLSGALSTRAVADSCFATPADRAYWEGYLQAMVDATGESREALVAWMERIG